MQPFVAVAADALAAEDGAEQDSKANALAVGLGALRAAATRDKGAEKRLEERLQKELGKKARRVPGPAAFAREEARQRRAPVSYTHLRAHETSAHL
eukprot:2151249-Alexandrium_andersonii.AAC.1